MDGSKVVNALIKHGYTAERVSKRLLIAFVKAMENEEMSDKQAFVCFLWFKAGWSAKDLDEET